jgi:transcriptional regulator with XRE-family HTH domain
LLVSKETPATSDNSNGRSEYVFRLDVRKLLEVTTRAGDRTGAQIFRRTGIAESSVSRYLRGEAQPDLNSAMRIAEAYDVDLRELMKRIPVEAAA